MSDELPIDPFGNADRLHPEGAPGIAQNLMRSVLGDEAYEERERLQRESIEMQRRHAELHELLLVAQIGVLWLIGLVICLALAALVTYGVIEIVS